MFWIFGYIALVNLLPNMILTLGEEIGWRGFLVPELTGWVGFRRASLYSGVIWGAWHLPGILTGAYGAAGTPKAADKPAAVRLLSRNCGGMIGNIRLLFSEAPLRSRVP